MYCAKCLSTVQTTVKLVAFDGHLVPESRWHCKTHGEVDSAVTVNGDVYRLRRYVLPAVKGKPIAVAAAIASVHNTSHSCKKCKTTETTVNPATGRFHKYCTDCARNMPFLRLAR